MQQQQCGIPYKPRMPRCCFIGETCGPRARHLPSPEGAPNYSSHGRSKWTPGQDNSLRQPCSSEKTQLLG
jgi:hypothetical protein